MAGCQVLFIVVRNLLRAAGQFSEQLALVLELRFASSHVLNLALVASPLTTKMLQAGIDRFPFGLRFRQRLRCWATNWKYGACCIGSSEQRKRAKRQKEEQ